jgi:uncharacterized membrane protein YvlD (DUF360 family)
MINSIKSIFIIPLLVLTFGVCMAMIYIVPALIISVITFDLSKYSTLTQHPTYGAVMGFISFVITICAFTWTYEEHKW